MDTTVVGKIAEDLQKAISGLDRAQSDLGGAAEHARQVQAKMRATGFHGVAQGLQGVIDQLHTAQTATGKASGSAAAAITPLRAITTETTPQQAQTQLTAAIASIGEARQAAVAAATQMGQANERVGAVLQGGQPGPLISMINGPRQITLQMLPVFDAAKDKAGNAITEAQSAGN